MLKMLRKNTKIIIWTVILSFILWGGFSVGVQFQKKGRMAGEVFGKSVSFQEFDSFYRANQIFSFDQQRETDDPAALHKMAWQSIVLSREAKRQKINVSDEEVKEEILRILKSQGVENPAADTYRRFLSDLRETPQEFEKQVRELLRIQKLMRTLHETPVLPAPENEVLEKYRLGESRVSLEIMRFPSLEDAEAFHKKAKNEKDWKTETEKLSDRFTAAGWVSLDELITNWQVDEKKAWELLDTEPGFPAPFPAGKEFIALRLLETQRADETRFDEEMRLKYGEILAEPQRYARFMEWSRRLMEEADLQDYLNDEEN